MGIRLLSDVQRLQGAGSRDELSMRRTLFLLDCEAGTHQISSGTYFSGGELFCFACVSSNCLLSELLGLPCPRSRRHLGRDRALGISPEVGRCGTSRYVFTLDVSANEVQPRIGDFVVVMGWFATL